MLPLHYIRAEFRGAKLHKFRIYTNNGTEEIPPPPIVGGGMVRAAGRERKKKGGGGKRAVASNATYAALLFPFFTPCAEHHSAKRGSVERNLQRSTTSLHKTACFQPYGSNFFFHAFDNIFCIFAAPTIPYGLA